MSNYEDYISIVDILLLIKKNLILFIIIPMLFGIMSFIVNKCTTTPMYEASTTVFVNSNKVQTAYITQEDVTLSKGLIDSYVEVAKSEKIKKLTLFDLDIEESDVFLISVSSIKNTQIMKVTVQAKSPIIAADFANTMVKHLSDEVIGLSKIDSIEVVDYAKTDAVMIHSDIKTNIAISIVLGVIVVFIFVFLRWFIDKTIRTEKDFKRSVSVPFIGSIIKVNTYKINNKQISLLEESYRNIRNNIINCMKNNDIKTILITSSTDLEGKSTTTCNVACAMSEIGLTVLVIDCNMSLPTIHEKLNLENDFGLSDFIENNDSYLKYIKKFDNNIDVLTYGKHVKSNSEIICSKSMIKMLNEARQNYDCVLIDGQPLNYADTFFLAQLTDGLIYVMKSGVANREVVYNNIDKLKSLDTYIMGGILNYVNAEECSNIPYKSKKEQFIEKVKNKYIVKQTANYS